MLTIKVSLCDDNKFTCMAMYAIFSSAVSPLHRIGDLGYSQSEVVEAVVIPD